MKWTTLNYSKTKVRSAGEYLIREDIFEDSGRDFFQVYDEYIENREVLSNWRAAHAYPMHCLLMILRKKTERVDKNGVVVQRLKRTPSIIMKLINQKGMKLDRIEDIGGCRAVVSNVKKVYKLADALKRGKAKHILHRQRDYILEPKDSGYRGVHLVYKFNNSKRPEYKGLSVEIQLRSAIQHSWATAVEVVGAFTKQSLKASDGDENWLRFFSLASAELANLEECSAGREFVGVDTFFEFDKLRKLLNVDDRLSAFAVTTDLIAKDNDGKGGFYILTLDMGKRTVNVERFKVGDFTQADERYRRLEIDYRNDPLFDVVMVSASSIMGLRKAYPNYFADTEEFLKNLNLVNRRRQKISKIEFHNDSHLP